MNISEVKKYLETLFITVNSKLHLKPNLPLIPNNAHQFFFGDLNELTFYNVLYTLWVMRFLYWTSTSTVYHLSGLFLWISSLVIFDGFYYPYVWYFFFCIVVIQMFRTSVHQSYAVRRETFKDLESFGTENCKTHLQPNGLIYKGQEYLGTEGMKKAAGKILRDCGWKDMNISNRKRIAFAFCHQYLLAHSKVGDESGFCSGGMGFSIFNPFAPVFDAPVVRSFWMKEGIEVKGWTCYTIVNPKDGFVTFHRAYHNICFNGKGDITNWKILRYF